jgi:hypothetical protein
MFGVDRMDCQLEQQYCQEIPSMLALDFSVANMKLVANYVIWKLKFEQVFKKIEQVLFCCPACI